MHESWNGVERKLAGEIISGQKRISKAKDIGIVCVTAVSAVSIIVLLIVNHLKGGKEK